MNVSASDDAWVSRSTIGERPARMLRMKLGLCLLLALASPFVGMSKAGAADLKSLQLNQAIELSLSKSGDLRDARTNVRQKQVELEQAMYARKSDEEKASGLFAKPQNLSQQLQIRMKVPQARMQLTVALEQLRQKQLEVRGAAEKSYLQLHQTTQAEAAAQAKRDAAQRELDAVKQKMKFGLAKQPELDAAQQALDQSASAYKQAQLAAKGERVAFGEKLGVSMEQPVAMTFEPMYADLSQGALPGYIDRALKTNVSLIQDVQTRQVADEKLNVTRFLYGSKFGEGRMKAFDRLIGSQQPDMDLFDVQYNALLDNVSHDWDGYLWIILPIPKKLFQGEYDGLRYLDDLRNGLPLAVMEQNKAALKEKESRSAVIAAVRQSYLDAKGAEEAYAQALRARAKAADDIGKVDTKRRLGLASAEEVEAAKDAYEQSLKQVLSAQIGYMNAISKLNVDTGGAVAATYKAGELPYEQIDDGLGAVKLAQEPPVSGKWTVKPAVGELLSELSVSPDKKLKATGYELFGATGKRIGQRTNIDKPVRALTLELAEPNKLKIALYRGEEKIGESPLAGSGTMGSFTLPKEQQDGADASEQQPGAGSETKQAATVIIGTVKVSLDALTSDIYQMAQGTMKASGQGMAFSPDGKAWFSLDNMTDAAQLDDPNGSAAVDPAEIVALKLTIDISGAGEPKLLLSADQAAKEIAALKEQLKSLEDEKQQAIDGGKAESVAALSTQAEDAKAQIALLEALLKGDAKDALKQISLINNPEAIMAALAEQEDTGEGAGGTGSEGTGTGGTGTGNAGAGGTGSGSAGGGKQPEPMSASELAAQASAAEAAVAQAIAAGDGAAAAKAVAALLAAQAQAADAANGTADGLAVLGAAKEKVKADLAKAQQANDPAKAESLAATLAAVQAAEVQLHKEQLFAELQAAAAFGDQLAAQAGAPGSPASEAAKALQAQIAEQLAGEAAELLAQIAELQLQLYTDEQLQTIGQIAEQIIADSGGQAETLPVQNLISPTMPLKLDVPPIIRDGSAYIPLRAVSESFGAAVDWDDATQTATVSTPYGTVECTIGSGTAYVNGEEVALEQPPQLIAERTFVPLRFLAESIGLDVVWNESTKTIELY